MTQGKDMASSIIKARLHLKGRGYVLCDAELSDDVNPTLRVTISSIPGASGLPEVLLEEIETTFQDGKRILLTPETVLVGNTATHLEASFQIRSMAAIPSTAATAGDANWTFGLTNVRLSDGDLIRRQSGNTHFKLKTVKFRFSGRDWVLIDLCPLNPKATSNVEYIEAIPTGRLETPFVSYEERDSVSQNADDIATLLCLATGRDIRWFTREIIGLNSQEFHWYKQSVFAQPFTKSASPPIDNGDKTVLKGFLEAVSEALERDRAWFYTTLDYFLYARLSRALQVRCTILNLLLDRVSTKIVESQRQYEIHPDLEQAVEGEQFKASLGTVLKTVPGWNDERTKALVAVMKQWNKTPSFPNAVRRACKLFNLPEPDPRLINTRHKLMHVGELTPGIKGMTGWAYDVEVEAVVLMLLLKILGYNGVFYHAKYKSAPISLANPLPA